MKVFVHRVFHYSRRHGVNATILRAVDRASFIARRLASRALGERYVRSRYGVSFRANWQDATFEMCIRGAYGTFLSEHLAGVDYPFVFVDIGANQGLYSLLAAKNPHCALVLAFEPVARTHVLLTDNIRNNGLSARIQAVRAGLSSKTGTAVIRTRSDHSGTASLRDSFESGEYEEETIDLADSASLDRLLPPDTKIIIKVDVEGHEETVLRELARGSFFPRVAEIFYEVNEDWCDAAGIAELLQGNGLRKALRVGSGRQYDVLASRH